jgi:hypothetical protein
VGAIVSENAPAGALFDHFLRLEQARRMVPALASPASPKCTPDGSRLVARLLQQKEKGHGAARTVAHGVDQTSL